MLSTSRLKYNRRAHATHTRDTPEASSSGDQGDCAGPHKIPYYIRPLSQGWDTWQMYLIHIHKHGEAAGKGDK